jgi:hypothetical protein
MKILLRNQNQDDWQLVESATYNQEKELHHLLYDSPSLISIEEIRPDSGPLVFAIREFGLSVGSIDLLAFSARGDIAIIECKLATNTEIKRKVIGQVLDYGAHLWEMQYDELDDKVREREGESLADLMQNAVDPAEWDEERFRSNVADTLSGGNFMLIIVVDEINDELSRIVSFMNVCGNPSFDFAALEMRRFQSDNSEMLVPRVIGPVRTTKSKSKTKAHRKWDESSFFLELETRFSAIEADVAKRILEWAYKKNIPVWWGEGTRTGSFVPTLNHKDQDHQLFAVYTYGTVEIYFQWYQYKAPFDDETKRLELLHRLNEIEGVDIPPDRITKRPNIKLSVFAEEDSMERLLTIYDWVVEEIKNS